MCGLGASPQKEHAKPQSPQQNNVKGYHPLIDRPSSSKVTRPLDSGSHPHSNTSLFPLPLDICFHLCPKHFTSFFHMNGDTISHCNLEPIPCPITSFPALYSDPLLSFPDNIMVSAPEGDDTSSKHNLGHRYILRSLTHTKSSQQDGCGIGSTSHIRGTKPTIGRHSNISKAIHKVGMEVALEKQIL